MDPHELYPGFFRRLGGLLIDVLVLAVPFALVAFAAPDAVRLLGPWGRVVGACAVLLYFAIGNSTVVEGQTLGKRLLGLRVVNPQDRCISLPSSSLRSATLVLPWMLNGLSLPWVPENVAFTTILALLIFGVPLCSAYLLLFNRPSRRCLHDLIASSVVVRTEAQHAVMPSLGRVHAVVASALFVLAALAPWLVRGAVSSAVPVMTTLVAQLNNAPSVWNASVSLTQNVRTSTQTPTQTSRGVFVRAKSTGSPAGFKPLAGQLAALTLRHWPSPDHSDFLTVQVNYEIDLLVFSSSRPERVTATPAQWREALGLEAHNPSADSKPGN